MISTTKITSTVNVSSLICLCAGLALQMTACAGAGESQQETKSAAASQTLRSSLQHVGLAAVAQSKVPKANSVVHLDPCAQGNCPAMVASTTNAPLALGSATPTLASEMGYVPFAPSGAIFVVQTLHNVSFVQLIVSNDPDLCSQLGNESFPANLSTLQIGLTQGTGPDLTQLQKRAYWTFPAYSVTATANSALSVSIFSDGNYAETGAIGVVNYTPGVALQAQVSVHNVAGGDNVIAAINAEYCPALADYLLLF